ncbi:pyrophosphatase PpaX [Vagococcus xieshaowenii]|uniref:Pyrophosphatase PpaX n=1 Tax=Vagococcus xieshaowenii TaxID=2562451 RepID=A0AAJ5JMN2_9ENTE|nr:pyrophosphatase PpaX [Vagococcus xieshaowenii]QCA28522.1 pyrophosphatase PpaX [Vagococcus xieshaowenii]TFZ42725.1 pyrophosphatase PpaX [Vagococcus xieshaowenii]
MKKVETVLFDFDGTLADTNHLIAQSYLHVLGKYFPGRFLTEESVVQYNGPSLEEVFGSLDNDNAEQMIKEYREYNHAKHDELIEIFPGVQEVLANLKQHGIKLAVVSTKKKELLVHGLKFLNIYDYFDVILGNGDFTKVKPNPESLNLAIERLEATPETTLMIGDNPQDIEAANRANVRGIFVEWSCKSIKDVAPYHPYKMVATMKELEELIVFENNGGIK